MQSGQSTTIGSMNFMSSTAPSIVVTIVRTLRTCAAHADVRCAVLTCAGAPPRVPPASSVRGHRGCAAFASWATAPRPHAAQATDVWCASPGREAYRPLFLLTFYVLRPKRNTSCPAKLWAPPAPSTTGAPGKDGTTSLGSWTSPCLGRMNTETNKLRLWIKPQAPWLTKMNRFLCNPCQPIMA